MKKVYSLITISIFFLLSCLGQKEGDNRGYLVKVGDTAPDFEMVLIDGSYIKLSALKGKVVMLQFTASWCGVCRKEMPFIEKEIWQILKDNEDFSLLAVDRDEPLETVKTYSEKVGITYPIGLDPSADIFASYALREAGITRNVIINREGEIIYLTRLFNREEFEGMKKILFEELAEQGK